MVKDVQEDFDKHVLGKIDLSLKDAIKDFQNSDQAFQARRKVWVQQCTAEDGGAPGGEVGEPFLVAPRGDSVMDMIDAAWRNICEKQVDSKNLICFHFDAPYARLFRHEVLHPNTLQRPFRLVLRRQI